MEGLHRGEENYLKAIYKLSNGADPVATRAIAQEMETKDSSVTDMLKRLAKKELITHKKYYGINLTETGRLAALTVIRRHRLWEVFLVDKLAFSWDKVHDLAEQLEHIQSPELLNRLDEFLGFPAVDPHGDPIPDKHGKFNIKPQELLAEAPLSEPLRIVRVTDDSSDFLQYLDASGLRIGTQLEVKSKLSYDQSMTLSLEGGKELHISEKVSKQILVVEL
ncbi:MAG: metal-dependent transcriptional regulator [Bacteroidia bacterium]|nr:metal-dependent transcriptional regulator [Bacteroidia bacterium]